MKVLAFLMYATGITDGELEASEVYDDEWIYEAEQCEVVAKTFQQIEDAFRRGGYFYCLPENK